MKRFLILAIIAVTLIACNKDEEFVPSANVDKTTLQFSYSGGVDSIKITSNTDWTVEKDAEWIKLSLTVGKGDAIVKVTVDDENTTKEQRNGTITFKAAGLAETKITVTQNSPNPNMAVDKQSLSFSYSSSVDSFAIASNVSWTIEEDADWITLSATSGNSNGIIRVEVDGNIVSEERSDTIIVKSAGLPDVKVIVTQEVPVPSIDANKQSFQFTHNAEVDSFAVISNVNWTIEGGADWITLSARSGLANANDFVKINVAENTVTTARDATITLKAEGLSNIEIKIEQSKALELVRIFMLSEGYVNNEGNTGSISYYDVAKNEFTKNYFSTANGKPLGDGANDLAIYGSKLYCAVTGGTTNTADGYIEVINPATGVSIQQIPVDRPRRIIFHENKAYVTTYSQSVVCIDTASLTIDKTATLSGTYAEDICLYNGNLYICNSGWGSGNTISVVNLKSFTETETITVPQNPSMIEATTSGEIYFTTADASWSGGGPSNLHILDPVQKQITHTFDIRASKIALAGDFIYSVDNDWATYESFIHRVNIQTRAKEDISDIVHDFYAAYSVAVNPLNGDFYVGGSGQDVAWFDKDANEVDDFKTGKAYVIKVVPVIR
jgi:hypothetical protein